MTASISVIVPAYQAEQHLAAALSSILGQEEPCEIVVVDDGSTDRTSDVARTFGDQVRLLRQSNAGPSRARNSAIEQTTGDLLMFLDADDLWPRCTLAHRLDLLRRHPEVDVVAGSFTCFTEPIEDVGPVTSYQPEAWWTFLLSASVIRRSAFESVGSFDETLPVQEDTDWYLRARRVGLDILRDTASTTLYRQRAGSLTTSDRTRQAKALFATIRRYRDATGPR